MYVSIWTWIENFERSAYQNEDALRIKLVKGYEQGWRCIRSGHYDDALIHFEENLKLAQRLKEYWWELFLDSNCCELFIYYKAEMGKVFDRTVRLATRAYKPEYTDCPARSRIYCNLADVYIDVDWFSYLDEVMAMLDYIEKDVPMDDDTHLRVRYIRAQIVYELERYDEAEDIVQRCLAGSSTNDYRMSHANDILSRIAYARGDLLDALSYAKERERYARYPPILRSVADALLWQAVLTWRLGDKGTAQSLFQQGIAEYERHDLPKRGTYYHTLCEYYELSGEIERALKLREEQLIAIQSLSLTEQTFAHLHYCRLLGRMGKPLDEALANARALTKNMKRTELYLKYVQRIEDGNYYLYDWQKA
jgi:tetratricopeptide (TPR) repeat protein